MTFQPLYRDLDPLRLTTYLERRVEDLRRIAIAHRQNLLPATAYEADGASPPKRLSGPFTVDCHELMQRDFIALEAQVKLPSVEGCCPAVHFGWGRRTEGLLYIDGSIATGLGTAIWDDGEPVWLPELADGPHDLLVHVERDTGDGQMRQPERSVLDRFDALLIHESTYKLAVAIQTAAELYEQLDPFHASRGPIRQALRMVAEALPIHDPEAVHAAADSILQQLLEQVFNNQELQPVRVGMFGHAHIDLAWLWTRQKTRRKSLRTFASQLALCKRFDWSIFQQGQFPLYQWVQEDAPEFFEQVRQALRAGRFQADGTIYVEPDTLAVGLESLIRQITHGRRRFNDLTGRDSVAIWMPDTFGFTRVMPQVMQQAGLAVLFTTKIGWNVHTRFPHDTFRWFGHDGSSVLVHFTTTPHRDHKVTTYCTQATVEEIKETWQHYRQKQENRAVLMPYGFGDGGGGPREWMLRRVELLKRGARGFVQVEPMSPNQFARQLIEQVNIDQLPTWHDDLYMERSRGSLSSQSRIKQLNHEIERLLLAAEAQDVRCGRRTDRQDQWERLLFCQFHDILPGTSIQPVYETEHTELESLRSTLQSELTGVTSDPTSADSGDTQRAATIANFSGCLFAGRVDVADQPVWVEGLSPLATIDAPPSTICQPAPQSQLLESDRFVAVVNHESGCLQSIIDKSLDRQVLAGEANKLILAEDRPSLPNYDAWMIEAFHEIKCIAEGISVESVQYHRAETFARCTVSGKIGDSPIKQIYTLLDGSNLIYVDLELDWKERQTVLKSYTEAAISGDMAAYGSTIGATMVPTHRDTLIDQARFEYPANGWVDKSEGDYGLTLMARAKYGFSCLDNRLGVTLLRSPISPDPQADQGVQHLALALFPHAGSWQRAEVPWVHRCFERPALVCKPTPPAEGFRFEALDDSGQPSTRFLIHCIKPAEGADTVLLRGAETIGSRGCLRLRFPARSVSRAWLCDLMEQAQAEIPLSNQNELVLEFQPFQLVSILLELDRPIRTKL